MSGEREPVRKYPYGMADYKMIIMENRYYDKTMCLHGGEISFSYTSLAFQEIPFDFYDAILL